MNDKLEKIKNELTSRLKRDWRLRANGGYEIKLYENGTDDDKAYNFSFGGDHTYDVKVLALILALIGILSAIRKIFR